MLKACELKALGPVSTTLGSLVRAQSSQMTIIKLSRI